MPAFPRGDIGFQIRMMDDDRIPTASETELADGRSAPMEPAEAIPLRDYVTYRLTVLAGLVTREGAARFGKEFGLGLPEWRIMRVLSVMPDLTVGQIAERIQMNKGLVSRTVAAMISKGQAIKSACAGDRRSFTVRLSDVGRELHDRILPVSQARQRRVRDCLTDEEREILFRALEKIEALVRTKGSFAPEDAPDDAPDARERR